MVNIVRVNTRTSRSGGDPLDPTDRWTSYTPINTQLHGVEATIHDISDTDYQTMVDEQAKGDTTVWGGAYTINMQRPNGVSIGTPVYIVVVRYSSGDTFGNTDGLAEVYDVFATREEAEALAAAIAKDADSRTHLTGDIVRNWTLTHNGRNYHKVWIGHFERFENVEIHGVIAL